MIPMQQGEHGGDMRQGHYRSLLSMVVLWFVAMYILMYAMIDVFGNVYTNFNQFYMAGLMAMPMVVIELLLMYKMYPDRRVNAAILVGSVVLLMLFWYGIRAQVGISDRQFLRSMIPHHGAAVLMCQRAPVHDVRVLKLCQEIIASQQTEIEQMKAILSDTER